MFTAGAHGETRPRRVTFAPMGHIAREQKLSRAASFLVAVVAYGAALATAFGLLQALPEGWHRLLRYFVADAGATVVIFGFSYAYKNTSLYDPYWSVIPPMFAVFWVLESDQLAPAFAQLPAWLTLGLVWYWGIRLTLNWRRDWHGLHEEDWRYVSFQEKMPNAYWLMSFFGLHFFPTAQVFLGMLPMFFLLEARLPTEPNPVQTLLLVGGGVWTATAITLELIADNQLFAFRKNPNRQPGSFLTTGLWKYSRHPNYFGEVNFWLGLWLMLMALQPTLWWTGIGWVAMLAMFFGYSIPAQDQRMAEKRPAFREWMRRSSAFVLWPPKKP